MSQLERELRSKRRANHKQGGSHTSSRSGSKSRVVSDDESSMFDSDTSDLNFSKLNELLKVKLSKEITIGGDNNVNDGGSESFLLNTPEVNGGASIRKNGLVLSREESRANSLIGSIIDSDYENGGSGKSENGNGGDISDEGNIIKVYSISDVIDALTQSRSKINSISREFLLGELYKLIIKKPSNIPGGIVNENDLGSLIGFIKNSRSSLELLLSLRSCVAYSCSDSDEVATVVIDDLFPILLSRIFNNNFIDAGESNFEDYSSNNGLIISNFVIAFFALTLVIFDGSNCYGLEENINSFMELCEGFSNSNLKENEEDILVNSFYGIGVILTLLNKCGREVNEYIQDLLPRLTNFLSNDYPKKIHTSVVSLIGLMYEIYDYPELDEELDEEDLLDQQPYYDLNELKNMIVLLMKESSKKISKKDKKESRSIFREVLKTIEKYTTVKIDNDDIKDDDILYRFQLNKAKALPIKSWFEYVRLIHLKYIFDTQLSLHYVSNGEIRDILMLSKDKRRFDTFVEDDSLSNSTHEWKDKGKNISGIKKELNIKHARDIKLQEQMHELGLDGEE